VDQESGATPVAPAMMCESQAIRKLTPNLPKSQLSDGTYLLNAELVDPGSDFYEDGSREVRCMVEFYLLFNFTSQGVDLGSGSI
jgi:hypothetical protein